MTESTATSRREWGDLQQVVSAGWRDRSPGARTHEFPNSATTFGGQLKATRLRLGHRHIDRRDDTTHPRGGTASLADGADSVIMCGNPTHLTLGQCLDG